MLELDLPFDEPQETYSTSEHLFHDLGIPHDAKGRLKPAAPKEPREPREQRSGGQGSGGGRGQKSGGAQRSRNRRSRNRTRGGQTVKKAE